MYIQTFFVFSFRKNCKTQVTTTDSKIVANAVLANLETPHEDTLKKRPAGQFNSIYNYKTVLTFNPEKNPELTLSSSLLFYNTTYLSVFEIYSKLEHNQSNKNWSLFLTSTSWLFIILYASILSCIPVFEFVSLTVRSEKNKWASQIS